MKYVVSILILALNSFSAEANEPKTALNIQLSTMGNNIAFDQNSIEVPLGTIKLTFTNKAKADSEISHNVILIRPEDEPVLLKLMESDEVDWDLDKVKGDKRILAQTKTLAPGQTDTLTFKPDQKGYYTYLCLMPGHAGKLGMKGVLRVK